MSRRSRPLPPTINYADLYNIYATYPSNNTPPPSILLLVVVDEGGGEVAVGNSKLGPKKGYKRLGTKARVA